MVSEKKKQISRKMPTNQKLYSDTQEAEIQGKFDTIFHQYFESVQTKEGTGFNLFYYKPPFSRNDSYNPRQEHMSFDEKISHIVNLVAYSQAPLLIRLFTAYKTDQTDNPDSNLCPEIVIPVSSIPTSYSGQTTDGEEFNLEKGGAKTNEKFPFNVGNTKVYLRIVCLNMSRSVLDDYIINDNVISTTSE